MFCPGCGMENQGNKFCNKCQTNLAIVAKFLARDDARSQRSRLISQTGLVSLIISEGFAWTLTALAAFVVIIFIATLFLQPYWEGDSNVFISSAILIAMILFCGIPMLLGLVLLLKDVDMRPKSPTQEEKNSKQEK
jgi:hypothetical protein